MNSEKNILIICYGFPPFPGIGGRRWAKFSKYLSNYGFNINVIASKNPFKAESVWKNDVKNISVTQLPVNYPQALITFPKLLIGRLKYKLGLLVVKLFTKGNYYDKTIFWKNKLINEAEILIKQHKIKHVIVSGAPFHLLHHSLKLKTLFPDLNLVVDYRDFWTDDLSVGPLSGISKKRIEFEKSLEAEVLKNADCVLTVSEYMTKQLCDKHVIKKAITIPNGFDENDFENIKTSTRNDNLIKFVFTGSLYQNIESVFVPFCEAIKKIKINNPDLYKKLRFEFYGSSSPINIKIVNKYHLENISFNAPLTLQESFQKIHESDFCLLFLNNTYSFSLSTKFCEYIGLKKPIVLFSQKGDASDFIQSNNFGVWINPDDMYNQLIAFLLNFKSLDFKLENNQIRDTYSVRYISNHLIEKVLV